MKKLLYIFYLFSLFLFVGPAYTYADRNLGSENRKSQTTLQFIEDVIKNEPPKTFSSSKAANDIINSIVNVVGLKPNFEIRAAKISNAAAVNYGGKRYILYDPDFMNRIATATKTDWAGISILAHEIGHHLNGHTLLTKGGSPGLELEADEFSGFVLRKMGATLQEAQTAMKLISNEKGSATHPKRSLRLEAIKAGYNSANDQILASMNQPIENPLHEPRAELAVVKKDVYLKKDMVFSEVHFNNVPDRKFYLTKKLDLVEVTENGIEVLGDVVRNQQNKLVLHINDQQQKIKLHVSPRGALYNDNNKVVGYLKNPSV